MNDKDTNNQVNNKNIYKEVANIFAPVVIGFLAVFVMMAIANGYDGKNTTNKKAPRNRRERIAAIDADIDGAMRSIDSIRGGVADAARDSLMRNRDYAFVHENADLVGPLSHIQDSLLDAAVRLAQRSTIMTVVPHNESVFNRYAHLRGMYELSRRYQFNQMFLMDYQTRSASLAGYERAVRNHFDSLANMQIRSRLYDINLMLNKKNEIISRHRQRNK